MDINSQSIEQIVKQVMSELGTARKSGGAKGGAVPSSSRVAMLTSLENYDIKEYPIPRAPPNISMPNKP